VSRNSKLKLILKKVEVESELIHVLTFGSVSESELPTYEAGAHVEFELGAVGKRSYSLVDWPFETDLYTVAVQREAEGEGGSKAMHAMSVGQEIETMLPQNNFTLIDGDGPVLLLAGGIGVTPLISMATKLKQDGRDFQLHYTARNASRMAFATALKQSFADAVNFYLDDSNPLELAELMGSQAPETTVYLCGPRGMIDAARTAAIAAGISADAIHIELFSSPDTKDDDVAFEVEISSTGQVINVAADQTIIEALEAADVDVMYDCQRGDCGICQCDVISGIPDHRDVVLSADEKVSGKVMQICVSRAKTARLVIDV